MNRKYRASALAVTIVVSLVGGLLVNRFETAQPAQASQTSQRPEVQKWEYCAITDISYFSGDGTGAYYRITVIYSSDPKNRVEMKVAAATDPLLSSLSKLGAEGWEMVGQATHGFNGYDANYLYFKRLAK